MFYHLSEFFNPATVRNLCKLSKLRCLLLILSSEDSLRALHMHTHARHFDLSCRWLLLSWRACGGVSLHVSARGWKANARAHNTFELLLRHRAAKHDPATLAPRTPVIADLPLYIYQEDPVPISCQR